MAAEKYMVFDKELWEEGSFYGCILQEKGLTIRKPVSLEKQKHYSVLKGVYLSAAIDSGQKETIWHRLRLFWEMPGNSSFRFSYYASDKEELVVNGNKLILSELLHNPDIPLQDKLSAMEPLWIEERKNPKDFFLFSAKGQYLWFKIELMAYGEEKPLLQGLRIDFPMHSIVQYLPEFYRSNAESFSFLSRFLGIFQSFLDDLNENIEHMTGRFDADAVDGEFLNWLAEWLAVDNPYTLPKKKLRLFMKNSFRLYAEKGTKKGLQDMLELYIGVRPLITETYKILECCKNRPYDDTYNRLYGEDLYSFHILMEDRYVQGPKQLAELKRIVELLKPAHTTANIILLKPFIVLGQHSYLALNSYTSNHKALELNGSSVVPFNTTILK